MDAAHVGKEARVWARPHERVAAIQMAVWHIEECAIALAVCVVVTACPAEHAVAVCAVCVVGGVVSVACLGVVCLDLELPEIGILRPRSKPMAGARARGVFGTNSSRSQWTAPTSAGSRARRGP